MTFRRFKSLVRDLIEVLPSRTKSEWQNTAEIDAERPTVILVSGFAANNRNLSVMRKRFIKDGYNVLVLSMDWQALSDGVQGLYRMAEKLSALVIQLKKERSRGGKKIYLVAHSAGGLVARYYVQLLGGYHYCDGLVTLATPHRGTWMAVLGFLCHLVLKGRCLFQMLPVSPFIHSINDAYFPSGFRWVSISSSDDLLCYPKSTILPAEWRASDWLTVVTLDGLTHGDFLLSKRTYRLVVSHLGEESKPVIVPATEAPLHA